MPSARESREAMARLLALLGPPPAPPALAAAGTPEWAAVLRLADASWLSGAMAWRVRTHGLTPRLPPAVRDYVDGAAELARQRAAAQVRQARRLTAHLNAAGLVPVFLKGTAALLDDLYPDPGVRLSSDIDLLLPADQVARALEVLRAAGYGGRGPRAPIMDPDGKHAPSLFHPAEPFAVEVHRHVLPEPLRRGLPADDALAAAVPLAGPGEARVLSPEHRIVHCVLHMIEDHRSGRRIALRQLLELRELAARGGAEEMDRHRLARRFAAAGAGDAAAAILLLAASLVAMPLPPQRFRPAARLRARLLHLELVDRPALGAVAGWLRIIAHRLRTRGPAAVAATVLADDAPLRGVVRRTRILVRKARSRA
ncbi:nucleotidyltransferase family protein [Azospirillum halopraeferens]|uniref:nucleotidyltransferase family protein n=1 Tax=Azospirillum halopraeferens TaxID=34010 RepID=UPI00041300CB|nr:nucleotidyltransferase family protein [Azospirillum halopraeferens]